MIFILNQTNYWNETLGCHSQYKGIFKIWSSIDIYLQSVDELLCSNYCPCYINRTTTIKFLTNINIAPYYNLWYTSNSSFFVNKFQKCDEVTYYKAYNNYLMRNSYFNYTLNQKNFDKYFSHIEKYFKCTGFCGLNYFNQNTQTNSKIVKYLFSDISEVPKNFGCLDKILDWFKINLYIFGLFFLCLFLLQLVLIVLVIITFNKKEENKTQEDSIPKQIIVSQLKDKANNTTFHNIPILQQNSSQNTKSFYTNNSNTNNNLNNNNNNNTTNILEPENFTPIDPPINGNL